MSKSNIALAIVAGVVIGGIVALVLKTEQVIAEVQSADDDLPASEGEMRFANIARQFSDRISTDLRTAEVKLKSVFKKRY